METTVGSAVRRLMDTQYTHTHLHELFPAAASAQGSVSTLLLPQERLVFVPDVRRWMPADVRLDAEEEKPHQMRQKLVVYRMCPRTRGRSVHMEMEVGTAVGRFASRRPGPGGAHLYELFDARNFRADEYMRFEPDLQWWVRDKRLDMERVRAIELLREKWKKKRLIKA
jgi:hypothetical protein